MGWSCWLNRGVYPAIEQVFEGVAQSRVRILQNWVSAHWDHLADGREHGRRAGSCGCRPAGKKRAQLPDLSELFVIDPQGRVLASVRRACRSAGSGCAGRCAGLREPFLHGPYRDPLTERLGASTSRFHDAVTLMFYQPVRAAGKRLGCLCAQCRTMCWGSDPARSRACLSRVRRQLSVHGRLALRQPHPTRYGPVALALRGRHLQPR